jgi:transcriptional regulator with XRE-family HTH domain
MDHFELKALRIASGLTQTDFAENLGVSRVFLGLMERGQKPISKRTSEAARSFRARPLGYKTQENDPLFRAVEEALINAGISYYPRRHAEEDVIEYVLSQPAIRVRVSRDNAKFSDQGDYKSENLMFINGATAIKFFTDLLALGGGRASKMPL